MAGVKQELSYIRPVIIPVSYTHLDVYKRQVTKYYNIVINSYYIKLNISRFITKLDQILNVAVSCYDEARTEWRFSS